MKLVRTIAVPAAILAACASSPAWAAAAKPKTASTVTPARDFKARVKSSTPSRVRCMYGKHPKDARRTITYTLVDGPKHGKVVMPAKHKKYYYQSSGSATYTSAKGYVGKDSFTWKLNDGYGYSNAATCSIDVLASLPVPQKQAVSYVVSGKAVDIRVAYTGGGGYSYAIKHSKPANGSVVADGTTFRYKPNAGFAGTDSFTWHMTYGKKGAAASKPTKAHTCWIVVKKPGITDWPQYRADEWRSGFTSMKLPAKLHLQWRRDIPKATSPFAARGKVYRDVDHCRPVQLGKTLFVPVTASDRLSAYDTDTGKLRWSFYASGAVRRPPAALGLPGGKGAVIFGSDDGWVYCLNAADGKVRWKFRAAPNNRKAMGFRRLSSVWPIWASPVISKGKVYFVAGYIPSFALYGYCLDAASGSVKWVNDGRISDIWNTSTFGPLALSYDGSRIYGTVDGASRPWVLDSKTGGFLGHLGVGFKYPGALRKGSRGWYVDGMGNCGVEGRSDLNPADPIDITAGEQIFTAKSAAALGVTGTVASLLAGDGKLFATTAEGGIYCFGPKPGKATVYPYKTTPLPAATDNWTAAAKAMLSRGDLKQGLALVLGVGSGRLVEELARQSSLMIVAVDPDHKKLQALRARMDAAGLSGARVSTLEGKPMDFAFAPYQAALITSEDVKLAGLAGGQGTVEKLYRWARPFGGEVWLPTSSAQHAALAGLHGKSKKVPLSEVARAGNFTRMARKGLPDEALRIKPPFGLVAFGSERGLAASNPLTSVWRSKDLYSGLPLKAKAPGRVPSVPKHSGDKGYPTRATVSTPRSIFTTMTNPLYGTVEKFPGLPSSGNDGSCTAIYNRYGDFGITHGKIASFFDTSAHYWGRMFFEAGGCPGRTFMWNGLVIVTATPVPGSTCGCSPLMQFTNFALAPMEGEENWVNYQRVRTSSPVEELPIRQVGVNFGAPGDCYVVEEGRLWTHHPFSGRYGRCSYNYESMTEALPLVPVSYSGKVKSVYRHSAQMQRRGKRYRGWVSASQVTGMTGITVPLAQPAVATKTTSAPKVDGKLDDVCWKGQKRLVFAVNKVVIDRDRKTGLPKDDEQCYAMLRYDEKFLYVAAGVHAEYGPPNSYRADSRRFMTVTLNSRERVIPDLTMTGTETKYRGKTTASRKSTGIDPGAWSYTGGATGKDPYTAEMAIPWKALAAAGLWKDQLIVNVSVSGGSLAGAKFLAQYTPLYLDKARGTVTGKRPHTVRLYFAEMSGVKPGGRVFEVSLQGKVVIAKLDVAKEAGGAKRELVKEFKGVSIADNLRIGFKPQAGEPMLSGVEIVGTYAAKDLTPNTAPTAAIDASTLSGPAPLAVTLSARNSSDPDGQIVQCAWNTGDGRLAKGSRLRHVYAEPGTYKVHLLLRDNRGATAAKSLTVKVTPGKPAAFVCNIRAKGGDYATLSAWESAMSSELISTTRSFKVSPARRKHERYTPADNGRAVTFTGGAKGVLKGITNNVAVVTDISGKPAAGKVTIAGGHSFAIANPGPAPGRALLFTVTGRGKYAAGDDGKAVTFTGGGTGKLRHINAAGLAFITDCRGTIKPGAVKCASGRSFSVADSGHPAYAIVAECYNDWPAGMVDSLKAPAAGGGWSTDALHCPVIRAAAGAGHKGKVKAGGKYAGFAFKGDLDASAVPHLRLSRVIVDPASKLTLGAGASVTRVLAGAVRMNERGTAADSAAASFSAGNVANVVVRSVSSYTVNIRDGRKQPRPPKLVSSRIGFYNCTAKTFDPGNQVSVEFVKCTVAPGGVGYVDKGYCEPAIIVK